MNRAARDRWAAKLSFGLAPDACWLFYAMFFWELGYGCYSAIQTLFIKSLGGSDLQIGVLIGIQGVIRVAITLPSGILADKFSRRKIMLWATAAGAPACIVAGLAQTWIQILPGLILLLVSNIGTPAMTAYISQMSTKHDRARNFAFIYTLGPAVGLIIAPALGGFLAERFAMRLIYFASAALYLIATTFFARVSDRPLLKTEHKDPSYREAIGEPVIRWVAVLFFAVLAACTMGVTFLPNYLEDVHHFNVGSIGRLFSIAAIGTVLISQTTNKLRWITPVRGVAVGFVAVAFACLTTLATGNVWILAFAFLGRGGFMVAWTLIYVVLGDVTPDRLRARAFAFSDFLGGIGVGLTPFAAGAIYGWNHHAPILILGCVAPFIVVGVFALERTLIRPANAARLLELEPGSAVQVA
jgi:MFS family permease